MKEKKKLFFRSEDLAVPEVKTEETEDEIIEEEDTEEITYDTLAVPEIHIHPHSKK